MYRKKEDSFLLLSSKQKIIKAACYYFVQRGYAATRTRDIAKRAGTNIALLNYYFQNKEQLFRTVVQCQTEAILQVLWPIVNNPATSLSQKVFLLTECCSLLFEKNPLLVSFLFRAEHASKTSVAPACRILQALQKSILARQLRTIASGFLPEHRLQILLLMIGMPYWGLDISQMWCTQKSCRETKKYWARKCIQLIKRTGR
jgi:AcrR family transcriptional regulator